MRREPRSSSGVVGAPLDEEDEEGGWKSPLWRLLRAGSAGLLLREMDRKKRLEEDFAVACVCSVVVEAAEEEAASDLSRLEEKTAAIRRIGGTWKRGGAEENRWQELSSELRVHRGCGRSGGRHGRVEKEPGGRRTGEKGRRMGGDGKGREERERERKRKRRRKDSHGLISKAEHTEAER